MSSEMLTDILGKRYKLQTSEKFDEYMKALGVGLMTRKMAIAITPIVQLTEEDGTYTLKTTSTFKNVEVKFKLGQELDNETPDGRKVKTTFTLEGNKLIQIERGEKESSIEREFTSTALKTILRVDDIVCIRRYTLME